MSLRPLVGVAALMMCAGVAISATTKIKAFNAAGTGMGCNPHADGMAIFKEDIDPVEGPGMYLHLHMQDLEPNTLYGVAIYATGVNPNTDADYSNAVAFTTNASGNGTFEDFMPTWDALSLGACPTIRVYVWDGNFDPDSVGIVTSSELRASGTGQ
jgi:hypothetical protein